MSDGNVWHFFCSIWFVVLAICHSERSEKSREHKVDVHEILPPFGRLNDKLKKNDT